MGNSKAYDCRLSAEIMENTGYLRWEITVAVGVEEGLEFRPERKEVGQDASVSC